MATDTRGPGRVGGMWDVHRRAHPPIHKGTLLIQPSPQGTAVPRRGRPIWPPPAKDSLLPHMAGGIRGRAGRLCRGGVGCCSPSVCSYPGNLCQVCVHVLVADLHHLSDPLVITARVWGTVREGVRPRVLGAAGPPPSHRPEPYPHPGAHWVGSGLGAWVWLGAGSTHSSTIFL